MAPRWDRDEVLRRCHKKNTNAAATARKEKQIRSAENRRIIGNDGDIMMGGYRIPTIISSKGAIQHKLDRYVPGEASKGEGHKRDGGRWDEFNHWRGKGWSSAPADDEKERDGEGSHRYLPIPSEDNYRSYNKGSRRDRYAREYHHAVSSSRVRYEKDRYASDKQHSKESSRTHFTSGSRYSSSYSKDHRSSRYSSHSTRGHSSSQCSSYSELENNHQFSNTQPRPHYRGNTENNKSYSSIQSQDYTRRYYDDQRVQANRGRLNAGNYQLHGHDSDFHPKGTFEEAMENLASHAARFLKNAHWRDRELIQTAVWKAYGDSIASLGSRNRRREDHRPREWISARGIPSAKDGDSFFGVIHSARTILGSNTEYVDGRNQRSAASAAFHRGVALENYRKANYDYEKTLDDLFGSGRSSRIRLKANSISSSSRWNRTYSYGGSDTGSYLNPSDLSEYSDVDSMHERSESSEIPMRGRSHSPSAGSDSTITMTSFRMRQEVPRPRPPRDHFIPTYTPDPNDPTRFLNVPRPRLREQWHIPADYYNGAAWADHRRSELETGAIPAFYPDKWFSGQSFGSERKDSEGKARAAKYAEEPLGRECYLSDPTPVSTSGSYRSQSAASELGLDFNAISLNSAPTSIYGGNRAESELPDDFDLYSPATPLKSHGTANRDATEIPLEQLQAPGGAPEQQATQLNRSNPNADDDGSQTPENFSPNTHGLYSSRVGSVVSDKSTSFALPSVDGCTRENAFLNNDLWHNSRQAPPTLCLADFINYDPNTSTNLLSRGKSSQGNLINSIPLSPNITRSWGTTQDHIPIFPIRKPESTTQQSPIRNGPLEKTIPDEDWENSFSVVSRSRSLPPSKEANKNNPMPITDSTLRKKPAHNSTKNSALGDLLGAGVRSDTETDDDLDFMGVDWYLE